MFNNEVMTQLSPSSKQQVIWANAGQWMRRGHNEQAKYSYKTQQEAIEAAQNALATMGGGTIMIDVPEVVSDSKPTALQHVPEIALQLGYLRVESVEGIPVFRISEKFQERLEDLMYKLREEGLTSEEEQELDKFEDSDFYFSHLNRVIRNMYLTGKL